MSDSKVWSATRLRKLILDLRPGETLSFECRLNAGSPWIVCQAEVGERTKASTEENPEVSLLLDDSTARELPSIIDISPKHQLQFRRLIHTPPEEERATKPVDVLRRCISLDKGDSSSLDSEEDQLTRRDRKRRRSPPTLPTPASGEVSFTSEQVKFLLASAQGLPPLPSQVAGSTHSSSFHIERVRTWHEYTSKEMDATAGITLVSDLENHFRHYSDASCEIRPYFTALKEWASLHSKHLGNAALVESSYKIGEQLMAGALQAYATGLGVSPDRYAKIKTARDTQRGSIAPQVYAQYVQTPRRLSNYKSGAGRQTNTPKASRGNSHPKKQKK